MSEVHPQRRLGFGLGIQQESLFGGLLQVVGTGRARGLGWGLCKSQSLGLRSPCIHSFSIIDVQRP